MGGTEFFNIIEMKTFFKGLTVSSSSSSSSSI
jgi:hypothetical protein